MFSSLRRFLGILFSPFGFLVPNFFLNYLAFDQLFVNKYDLIVVETKCDILQLNA